MIVDLDKLLELHERKFNFFSSFANGNDFRRWRLPRLEKLFQAAKKKYESNQYLRVDVLENGQWTTPHNNIGGVRTSGRAILANRIKNTREMYKQFNLNEGGDKNGI